MHYLFDRPLDTFNTSNYTGNYEKIRTPTDLAGPHAINEQGHGYSGILYYVTGASTNISKCTAEIIKVTFDCHRKAWLITKGIENAITPEPKHNEFN